MDRERNGTYDYGKQNIVNQQNIHTRLAERDSLARDNFIPLQQTQIISHPITNSLRNKFLTNSALFLCTDTITLLLSLPYKTKQTACVRPVQFLIYLYKGHIKNSFLKNSFLSCSFSKSLKNSQVFQHHADAFDKPFWCLPF